MGHVIVCVCVYMSRVSMELFVVEMIIEWVRLFTEADARVYWASMKSSLSKSKFTGFITMFDARAVTISKIRYYSDAYSRSGLQHVMHRHAYMLFRAKWCDP